ncbi:MAG: acyltransferase family protein, partial [Nitrospirae bacterium]|nr:acyltransferase family protein [Nitrospirota bacterium]
VFLHVVSPMVAEPSAVPRWWWWTVNVYDAFLRPCVPLFVMVSGLLLLDPSKVESLGLFFKKRMMKVLLPFLFWGVIYLVVKASIQATPLSLPAMLRELVSGPIYTHFWFLYMILGLYLAAPILRVYVAHAPVTLQYYFLALWFMAASIFPLMQTITGVSIGIPLVVATQYVGYFVLGPLLRERVLGPRALAPAVALFAGCGLFTAAATGAIVIRFGSFHGLFYEFLSPNVVVMSVCAFLILRSLPWQRMMARHRLVSGAITQLSAWSFGIYIVHYLLVELLRYGKLGIVLPGPAWPPLITAPVTAAVALAMSVAVVAVIRLVPLGRYLVP